MPTTTNSQYNLMLKKYQAAFREREQIASARNNYFWASFFENGGTVGSEDLLPSAGTTSSVGQKLIKPIQKKIVYASDFICMIIVHAFNVICKVIVLIF